MTGSGVAVAVGIGRTSPSSAAGRSIFQTLVNPLGTRHDAGMTDSSTTTQRFTQAALAAFEPWRLGVTPEQLGLLYAHYEMMIEANRTINLTRITEPVAAAVKHYADSLALSVWAQQVGFVEGSVLDVGTGAGFPAVPLAVMHPTWQLVAIDGTRKKIDFVARAVAELRLKNLEPTHAHADHWNTNRRFDVVCTRAVASLAKSLPFAARLAAPKGWFVAFKTPASDERERAEANQVAVGCKMIPEPSFDYELVAPDESLTRRLVVYRQGG